MQETQADDSARFLSPLRAFWLICVIVSVGGGLLFLLELRLQDTQSSTQITQSLEQSALRPAEIFRKVNGERLAAYRSRDVTLIDDLYTATSPVRNDALREISRLLEEGVQVQPRLRTLWIDVEEATEDEIRLVEKVTSTAVFFSESGDRLKTISPIQRQTIKWHLRLEEGTWRIHDSLIVGSREVGRR
jgi:hypothetical protein